MDTSNARRIGELRFEVLKQGWPYGVQHPVVRLWDGENAFVGVSPVDFSENALGSIFTWTEANKQVLNRARNQIISEMLRAQVDNAHLYEQR